MKFYYHPMSSSSCPVNWFLDYHGIPHDKVMLDLEKGEHYKEPFNILNPASQVPFIEDDGFVLTESKAILQYLASKHKSDWYSDDLKERARIDEALYFIHDDLNDALLHMFAYPQAMPDIYGYSEGTSSEVLKSGKQFAQKSLQHINDHYLGKNKFLVGDHVTIADAMLSSMLNAAAIVKVDFKKFPNIEAWIERMQGLDKWMDSYGGQLQWREYLKEKDFVSLYED